MATGAEPGIEAAPSTDVGRSTEVERCTEAADMRPVIAIPTINPVVADTIAVVQSIVVVRSIAAARFIVVAIASDTPARAIGAAGNSCPGSSLAMVSMVGLSSKLRTRRACARDKRRPIRFSGTLDHGSGRIKQGIA